MISRVSAAFYQISYYKNAKTKRNGEKKGWKNKKSRDKRAE